jgi:GTP-binding protein
MSGFVDEAQIHVKAGDGGAGSTAFRREAHVSKGGPDGGDGGSGGDVYLEASNALVSLYAFKDHPFRRAENGGHGGGGKRHGRNGEDLVVSVPQGTVVRAKDGAVLADLTTIGDRLLAVHGGRGGRGNVRFASNRLRAPAFAEQGEVGEESWFELELKLIADVALVGFPNAGKSTLISRISAAKPKIAPYPFTTLEPHLGVVAVSQHTTSANASGEFIIADIPGLIEGASQGRGLGHEFLRHIERARVLLVLIDLAASEGRSPQDQLRILMDELRRHSPALLDRPHLVVGSRADTVALEDRPPLGQYGASLEISSVTGEGIDALVGQLQGLVAKEHNHAAMPKSAPVTHRPEPEGVLVTRVGVEFVVTGRDALRAVGLSDLTNPDAIALVQSRLKRLGVNRALVRAGAREGDTVRIGAMSFTYAP